jgi:hypothetical protein
MTHNNLPDPVEEMLWLAAQLNRLDEKVTRMEKSQKHDKEG